MSATESMIWHILGYASFPFIIGAGFCVTALIACFLLEKTGNEG